MGALHRLLISEDIICALNTAALVSSEVTLREKLFFYTMHSNVLFSFLGVILPNSSINIPITFISPNSGIFLETWVLETQPILCGGEPISIILRGVATEEDMLAKERKELEVKMTLHVMHRVIGWPL